MRLTPIFLAAFIATPFGLEAQPIASKPQGREWTEKSPPNGLTITNTDKYVDYLRDGKTAFRDIERVVTVTAKGNQQVSKTTQHLLEFVVGGNVFASVFLAQGGAAPTWTVLYGKPVYFTSGMTGVPARRFFHACVPSEDYYEYVEIVDDEIKPVPETADSYAARKHGFSQMTERGYFYKLGREQLLDTEKKLP